MKSKQKSNNIIILFHQLFKKTWLLWILVLVSTLPFFDLGWSPLRQLAVNPWYQLVSPTILLGLCCFICSNLTQYFSLLKKETAITWSQIIILIFIGLWIAYFIWIFQTQTDGNSTLVLGVFGALLAWIFQDKVKGAIAFIHIRLHHELCIDDWIQVPKYHIDGEVKHITLTTITIYNWDTTTSVIPTSSLNSEHFINLQKMAEDKTYGHRMLKSFVFDTDYFHVLTVKEAEQLKVRNEITSFLPEEEIREGVLNAHLYRLYLYHWLMNQPYISQKPLLIVRWLEQKDEGMPLQVYAFIMKGQTAMFEWQQSQIIEHVIESLEWFGLRLYQTLSSHNINKHLSQLTGKKEFEQ